MAEKVRAFLTKGGKYMLISGLFYVNATIARTRKKITSKILEKVGLINNPENGYLF